MARIIKGYDTNILISYCQKDNEYDGWATESVENLKKELEATFKKRSASILILILMSGFLEQSIWTLLSRRNSNVYYSVQKYPVHTLILNLLPGKMSSKPLLSRL